MRAITPAQLAEIGEAVSATHRDLLWVVGEHPDLLRLLELLASKMFLAGLASKQPASETPDFVKEIA